jgi:hypothetical protein
MSGEITVHADVAIALRFCSREKHLRDITHIAIAGNAARRRPNCREQNEDGILTQKKAAEPKFRRPLFQQ